MIGRPAAGRCPPTDAVGAVTHRGMHMGYDTTFEGRFTLDRPLTTDHQRLLNELAQTEHAPGEDGVPVREARSGRPCPYCQWVPTADRLGIEWDGGEKFYGWLEWLGFIVERRIGPWGYRLNGEVRWRGEGDIEHEGGNVPDAGVIYVRDNRIEAVPDQNPGPSWDRRLVPVRSP